MEIVLGLDLGTTSAKGVAFDAAGHEHSRGEVGYPLREPGGGRVEQDAEEVVAAALRAMGQGTPDGARIAGVSFSSAMHTLVGLGGDGRPLTPLLTWADTRAAGQAERLRAQHPDLHRRTGTPIHPMSPLVKLVWFRETEPELFSRVRRWAGVKELVMAELTGEWVIDASCASGTGLLSLQTLDWDAEALAVAGVRPEQLSRVVCALHTLPLRAGGHGMPTGTPLVVGAGDGPLANVGLGAVRPGAAACSIGTSGALRLVVEDPGSDAARHLFCYALTPGRWVVGGAISNGGSVLQWAGSALAPDLGPHPEEDLLALAAEVPAGSDGLLMLPYLRSERAPHWSALPRGAYVGLTYAHRRGHLVRAALEGVSQQLALVLASLRDASYEVREIRATGGFARSPVWRQLLTDALGMPVGFAVEEQGSALGAALVGMEALGIVDSIERAADLVRVGEVLVPDPAAAAVYTELRPVFASLYEQLTPAFRALGPSRGARGPGADLPRREDEAHWSR